MDERWMVDDARDELILTATLMQRLHDKLRFGLLRPEQADAATGAMLGQLKQALALVDAASAQLHSLRKTGTVASPSAVVAPPASTAEPFGVQKPVGVPITCLESEICRQAAAMGVSARSCSGSFTR
jgi:hypothetical protein